MVAFLKPKEPLYLRWSDARSHDLSWLWGEQADSSDNQLVALLFINTTNEIQNSRTLSLCDSCGLYTEEQTEIHMQLLK